MHIGKEQIPVYHLDLVRDYSVPFVKVSGTINTADVLHSMLDSSPVEQFVVIYVGSDGSMCGAEKIAQGDLENVAVGMKNIFRGAIHAGVPAIILGHNHPMSGKDAVTPSDPDLMVTATAIEVGRVIGIEVIDHVIVSPNGQHYSIWDNQEAMEERVMKISTLDIVKKIFKSHPLTDPLYYKPSKKVISDIDTLLAKDAHASLRF